MADAEARILVCTQQCPQGRARGDGDDGAALALLQAVIGELDRGQLWTTVSVEFKGCPSPCSQGPALLIYPEGVLYDGVTPDVLPAIIGRHFPSPVRHSVLQCTQTPHAARPSGAEGHRDWRTEREPISTVPPPADTLLARARAACCRVPPPEAARRP